MKEKGMMMSGLILGADTWRATLINKKDGKREEQRNEEI